VNATIDAQDVKARVEELPALPQALHEVVQALNDDDLRLEVLARKIAVDPILVTKILRAANSPFYGVSGSVGSVDDAVRLIGVRTVGIIVSTVGIVQAITPPSCAAFDFKRFWAHSIATGICSQELARECGYPLTVAFVAGLLHDIGQLALATYYPREFTAAARHAQDSDCPRYEAENEVLGFNHGEVGAWLASHWRFTDTVSQAIQRHHQADCGSDTAPVSLTDIVHSADGIVHALDLSGLPGELVPRLGLCAWQRLNVGPEGFLRIFERTARSFDAMCRALL
jgi:putative nucleotidyltransferase with HDIG domain